MSAVRRIRPFHVLVTAAAVCWLLPIVLMLVLAVSDNQQL